eukprot:CAMPEP_0206579750 /NCGR_PEP_ID=MMETSP0325_2-20121206/32742_1 /ASSEMBLY_ACC=CAM_ASM_000347 /TAXON_ID=2866 /ORGANISM="Crypthecodinium cohnii, Strain Seligo" /LENGTH=401 /DNA_ID=CAMNT_0054085635 /DNA_START=44 /DNA_END=1246 /DNA_ORIENTATION=+
MEADERAEAEAEAEDEVKNADDAAEVCEGRGDAGVVGRIPTFSFLPKLTVARSIEERVAHLRAMQSDAKLFVEQGSKDVDDVKELLKVLKEQVKQVDSSMERARNAWNVAMQAERPEDFEFAKCGEELALEIIRELHNTFPDLSENAQKVDDLYKQACDRVTRAETGHAQVKHFWEAALESARKTKAKLASQRQVSVGLLQRAEVSKRTAMLKADSVVQLVLEKQRRWQDEHALLQEDARLAELFQQAEIRRQQEEQLRAHRAMELEQERLALERQREEELSWLQRQQAAQWGYQQAPMQAPMHAPIEIVDLGGQSEPPPPTGPPPPMPPQNEGPGVEAAPPPPPDAPPPPMPNEIAPGSPTSPSPESEPQAPPPPTQPAPAKAQPQQQSLQQQQQQQQQQ